MGSKKIDEKLAAELVKWTNNAASVEAQIIRKTAELQRKQAFYNKKAEEVRAAILDAFERSVEDGGPDEWENDMIRFKYIKPTFRKGIDLDMLRKNRPQIYARYLKKTPVKASVRITVK